MTAGAGKVGGQVGAARSSGQVGISRDAEISGDGIVTHVAKIDNYELTAIVIRVCVVFNPVEVTTFVGVAAVGTADVIAGGAIVTVEAGGAGVGALLQSRAASGAAVHGVAAVAVGDAAVMEGQGQPAHGECKQNGRTDNKKLLHFDPPENLLDWVRTAQPSPSP